MRRAIVTGASSGIGRAVAAQLLAGGWQVGLAARRTELLDELSASAPGQAVTARIDVTAADASDRLLALIDRLGGVNLFVHCAGVGKQNPQLNGTVEEHTVSTNVLGFTRMTDTMFNYMAANGGGDIVAVSSIAGVKGIGVAASYSASKAYQNTYLQALEQLSDMRRLHIRITDVRPGFVDTPLLAGTQRYPMMMNADDVARTIIRSAERHRHVVVTDWRYRLLVTAWRMLPRCLWRRLNIGRAD